ncbi:hypothetical protein [Streptomyces sp. H021]|uniref:hypothetical protein n=1 Tax=Streptomyces sp. H021 TaxID=1519486 RepID=UPI00131DF1F4|nr:hypothetical protein [Streptomyces sp. H021]
MRVRMDETAVADLRQWLRRPMHHRRRHYPPKQLPQLVRHPLLNKTVRVSSTPALHQRKRRLGAPRLTAWLAHDAAVCSLCPSTGRAGGEGWRGRARHPRGHFVW